LFAAEEVATPLTTRSNRCNRPKISGDDRCETRAEPTLTRSERR